MGYFDTEKGAEEYERMVEGYDGKPLVERLRALFPLGGEVLELGMGPGKDLDLLNETFATTGSDASQVFLDRYKQRNPAADLVLLDAVTLETDRTFDAIFSNKVLVHLTREELSRSLARQAEVLRPEGYLLHSLWFGDKEEESHGLRFVHYTADTFLGLVPEALQTVSCERYTELEENDSMVVVLRHR